MPNQNNCLTSFKTNNMKHTELPPDFQKFFNIINEMNNLLDQLTELDLTDMPNDYYKSRMIDKVEDLSIDLQDFAEEMCDKLDC